MEKVKRIRQLPALAWIYGRVELFQILNTLVQTVKGLYDFLSGGISGKGSSDHDSRAHGGNFFI